MIPRLDAPYVPDGDEARRWAEQELSDPRYADAQPTWFDYLARDIGRFLAELFTADSGSNLAPAAVVVIIVIALAALIVALLIWGAPRRSRAVRRQGSDLLGVADDRAAAHLRSDADRAAKNGDWDEATILRYRALARGMWERDLIDPAPGATAQSIAREVAGVFPAEGDPVRQAAGSFDDVRYLRRPATAESYEQLAATDARLSTLHLAPVQSA